MTNKSPEETPSLGNQINVYAHKTFVHRTHQYTPKGLDPLGSKTTRIVNQYASLNINQEHVNIVSVLL